MITGQVLNDLKSIHAKLGEDGPAFSEFRNSDIINKEFKIVSIAIDNFDIYDKVVIIGSRFPINYTYEFNRMGLDNIIVIDYHPMLDKHRDLINADVIIKRPLFDDLTHYVKDADLVVFPNTEYMVPLNMLNYYKHCKNVIAVNHINMLHNFNNYVIDDSNVFKKQCHVSEGGKIKIGYTDSIAYYAYGINTCL